ncbi:P-loop NTPase [Sanguibacter sp. Leaf3]|uniref:P-loop NTPase n=1 Tax=Sanguibacter sp. Leaf3 TaxID=1736209 RepID=UPI00138EE092|nr:SIR2 family protein [Sanguibacter sp. Leaf3]
MDEHIEKHLNRVIASGDAILFVGAGFSREARDTSGRELPAGVALGKEIWKIAFPVEPYDRQASLQDIFSAAKRTNIQELKRLLEQRLRTAPRTLPEFYKRYFHVAWSGVYTINIDNVLELSSSAAGRPYTPVSGLSNRTPIAQVHTITHLNGMLSDFPNVTFTADDFGARTARTDGHYAALASRLPQSPVIYIGTELDESPLWHHIAARGRKAEGRELRPRSYLVSPSLGLAKKAALKEHNVYHIPMTARDFSEKYLPQLPSQNLVDLRSDAPSPWTHVSEARLVPVEDPANFLLGREPQWGDIVDGYAIERSFEHELATSLSAPELRVAVVTGTVGSGKSTTLRRLALFLDGEGQKVLWLERSGQDSLNDMARKALAAKADYVFIDEAERFAGRINTLILAILGKSIDSPRIVVATPSTHRSDLDLAEIGVAPEEQRDFVMPHLANEDIDNLLDALHRARRLGVLVGRPLEEQRRAFRNKSQRQLLVALLEATSGQRFEEMIKIECEALTGPAAYAYASCAIATTYGYPLSRSDFLSAIGGGQGALQQLDALERQRLIFRDTKGRYATRHSLIAARVVSHYRTTGQLSEPFAGITFTMAAKQAPGNKATPERRLLTDLINHDKLRKTLEDRSDIRKVFSEIEDLLEQDAHYWLQRGSFELESGDIRLAENFLGQARALSEGDFMIDTEWSYLRLRQAINDDDPIRAGEHGGEALNILFEIIDKSGHRTPNTYAVLLQEGAEWLLQSALSETERRTLMSRIRDSMLDGRAKHPGNMRLKSAAQSFERLYLLQAVNRSDSAPSV